jgi:hypothetical protein
VEEDKIDDILIATPLKIFVYKGGKLITNRPSYTFTKPAWAETTASFGSRLINLGDICGSNYPSLLVTDPECDVAGGYFGGTVFLYNMGKALKDSCVAIASVNGFGRYFGTQAIALGDVSGDSLADFMVAQNEPTHDFDGAGGITVFLGNNSYGPPVSVRTMPAAPASYRLDQNVPNPASTYTDITFGISNTILRGHTVTLTIHDMLGHQVLRAFDGVADGFGYTVRVGLSALPAGIYAYTLSSGSISLSKRMCVIK